MSFDKLTLSELKEYELHSPLLAGFPSRILAKEYDDFVEVLYHDLDKIISIIQENPELRKKDAEDRLTIDFEVPLRCMGYEASHDSKIGGHADLVVKKNTFLWIGEAKIHRDYNYLLEGFLQLSTRYSTGASNQKNGGIFIYIRQQDAKSILERWEKHLLDKVPNLSCHPCQIREESFFSEHKHERSGRDFKIRHMPVILYFEPKDKSGRVKGKKTRSKYICT